MPLPPGIETVVITQTYVDGQGAPLTGTVTFTLSNDLLDADDALVIGRTPIEVPIDASGAISVELPHTDDADLSPVNWYVRVDERIDRGPASRYYIQLPASVGAFVQLRMAPQVFPENTVPLVVTSVDGRSGVVTLTDRYPLLTGGVISPDVLPDIDFPVVSVNGNTGIVNLTAGDVGALSQGYVPPVTKVNNKTGAVVLSATDVGALPSSYTPPVASVNGHTGTVALTASDVSAVATSARGAANGVAALDGTGKVPSAQLPPYPSVPVTSVNTLTGAVVLDAADVGALPDDYTPPVTSVNTETGAVVLTAGDVGAIPTTAKAQPNGVASLNSSGQVPIDQSRVSSVDGQTGDVVLDYATDADVTSAVSAHVAATDPHGDRAYANATFIPLSQKGANSGIASLDSSGKLITSQLPSVAITDTFVVANQAAMLGLTAAQQGDIAIRTDLSESFILTNGDPSVLANWQFLESPSGGVTSVNGQTGIVNLDYADVGALADTLPGEPDGLAQLDSGGKVPAAQLPPYPTVPVSSVNGQTGAVVLDYTDVGALADTYTAPVTSVDGQTGDIDLSGTYATTTSLSGKLSLSGGTMTGALTLSGAPSSSLHATTKAYADGLITTHDAATDPHPQYLTSAEADGSYLPLVGGTLTGPLTLAGDPSSGLQAATKSYVDTQDALAIPLSQKGAASGVATLDGSGKLTASQALVASVNGSTGAVTVSTSSINALPTNAAGTINLPSATAGSGGTVGSITPGVVINIGGSSNDPNDVFTQGWRINIPADPSGFTRSNVDGGKGSGNGASDAWSSYFNGQQTGYGNELGELRANAGKTSTVAFRAKAYTGTSDNRKVIDATDSTGTTQGAFRTGGVLHLNQRSSTPSAPVEGWTSQQMVYAKTDGSLYTQNSTAERQLATTQEKVNTVATAGSAQTIPDVVSATQNDLTLTAATCTLTFPSAGAGKSFLIVLRQDATGSRTVTWPASVKWAAGTAPTLSASGSKVDVVSMICIDGTNWLGFLAGADMR